MDNEKQGQVGEPLIGQPVMHNGMTPSGQNMQQPYMMQPGMAQPGMVQPGMVQPGVMQPGVMQPGVMMSQQILGNGQPCEVVGEGCKGGTAEYICDEQICCFKACGKQMCGQCALVIHFENYEKYGKGKYARYEKNEWTRICCKDCEPKIR